VFLNCSVVEFGGEGIDPKSKLKIAPEVLGAEVVVAVIVPVAVVSVIAPPLGVIDTEKVPALFGAELR